jgi:transposase
VPPHGPSSQCLSHQAFITEQVQAGLTARRIWQDLVADHGFTGGYDSVRRFVQRLGRTRSLPFRRMECGPGEEAQVDFGVGAPVVTPDGKRRKANVFRIVLSHSRKAYSEATFTQTTEDFFRCLENAFAHFGGVPKTLVIDNLKAAVAHPDWFDPELTPKVQSFCRHYGTRAPPR